MFQNRFENLKNGVHRYYMCVSNSPYGKAVFVRISDEYAANILRTASFTVIVSYIFTSCQEYPATKVGLAKK